MCLKAFALFSVVGLFACGGGGDGPGGVDSSGIYSCDVGTGDSHDCVEYDWSGGASSSSSWEQACSSAHGTSGDGCSHSGAIGGCKITVTSSGITVHTTSWVYSGDTSSFQSGCSESGGTFVAP